MPYGDFDVNSLARYLHLAPQQVVKLAERGKLPGRKVGGEWRFAKPDIHHWFEHRIGVSDELELLEVEAVLQRSAPPDEPAGDLHRRDAAGRGHRRAALCPNAQLGDRLDGRTGRADRLALGHEGDGRGGEGPRGHAPTALENGVALLHPRRPMAKILGQPFLALGCTSSGIPFGGDGPLTDVFFLICSMEDRGHLRVLARLSRILTSPGFLNALHQADNAAEAHQLIVETEENCEGEAGWLKANANMLPRSSRIPALLGRRGSEPSSAMRGRCLDRWGSGARVSPTCRFGRGGAGRRRGSSPDVIVVAQAFPGQFSHQAIDRLRRLAPLARMVGLMGSWCEGEMRTGSPWPARRADVLASMGGPLRPRVAPAGAGTSAARGRCRRRPPKKSGCWPTADRRAWPQSPTRPGA